MNKIICKKNINKIGKEDIKALLEKKVSFFQDTIQKTIIHVQKNKMLDILGVSEVNNCIQLLNQLSEKINILTESIENTTMDAVISNLQIINNDLSSLFKTYGTDSLDDLLAVCFGNNQTMTSEECIKYEILKKYFHPTGYKVILSKPNVENKSSTKSVQMDETVTESMKNVDCYEVFSTVKSFHMKVYGMKVYIYNSSLKKNLLIYGIVDDIVLKIFNNSYITNITKMVGDFLPSDIVINKQYFQVFHEFFRSLTLKDYLIYNYQEIYQKFFGMISQFKILKQKSLTNMVKDYIQYDLYTKRNTLIYLLLNSDNYENKYIAYLLYDLLSNDTNGSIDTLEQTILFDSLPWSIKDLFRDAMKKTVQYTNELSNFDITKIPLEQQICLLKSSESVKEKAMIKLKEVKSKSEDSGSKARQYLDGLLKIPFQIYKKEKIMTLMDEIKSEFKMRTNNNDTNIDKKKNYTGAEIIKFIYMQQPKESSNIVLTTTKNILRNFAKNILLSIISNVNKIISEKKIKLVKLKISNKNKQQLIVDIDKVLDFLYTKSSSSSSSSSNLLDTDIFLSVCKMIHSFKDEKKETKKNTKKVKEPDFSPILSRFDQITDYIINVKNILDDAIHGHDNAKKQIERIIGQWINGEQDGYCFGFEGPPGVGKTSLAKRGLSNCLKDESGEGRPFAMIQMGGDSNGSTLHGHNYTYVGSTWGGIVQILIDKKCMNPIIFIDELDKISRTEQGREIVGILTHLLDPTQNDNFQDKYFSGIDLDLSKALFILSYNDVDSIDKILLDRIHRIKFKSLSLEDKLIIAKTHMLPEIYKKMGMEEIITFSPDVLTLIIEEYTCEPGVRKLREVLFEVIGEINLDILKNKNYNYTFPINITISDIKTKYFKEKQEVRIKKIHESNSIGIINGLWANALGKGGVIPIQAKFYPCDKFLDLKLTGMQGDVMKESMNVALTLAWTLTTPERKDQINEMYNQSKLSKYGIHIHCPEGAVPKDGPSAGTAITTVIYSILNNLKIKSYIAITGEISLDGQVTEIGGLDVKILGGIKAGVKQFIFPAENKKDFDQFMEKYKNTDLIKNIQFCPVREISEVFEMIFE